MTKLSYYQRDAHIPDSQKYYKKGHYFNKELGIKSDWNIYHSIEKQVEEDINEYLQDANIQKILHRVPERYKYGILKDVKTELYFASINNCSILSTGGRKQIINRIYEIESKKKNLDNINFKLIHYYSDFMGLLFNPTSIDELYKIKNDKKIRNYAHDFLDILRKYSFTKNSKKEMALLIKTAMDTYNISSKISGVFHTISLTIGLSELINALYSGHLSTGLLAGGVATHLAAEDYGQKAKYNQWYELANRVKLVKSKKKILEFLKS